MTYNFQKLKIQKKNLHNENLTTSEIVKALKELPHDKTPGNEGFTINLQFF